MSKKEIFGAIRTAIDTAPRNGYVAELHLQCLKYAKQLEYVSGREFCEGVGLKPAWGTEFVKMKKIVDRLLDAGLATEKI